MVKGNRSRKSFRRSRKSSRRSRKSARRSRKSVRRSRKSTRRSRKSVRRSRKSARRSRQSGGFLKELDHDYVRNWRNIHKQRMDCCPCVFNLLGLNLYESNFMVGFYGGTGMKNDEIIMIFSEKFPNYSFSFVRSSDNMNISLNNIKKLKDGTYVGDDKYILYSRFFKDYQMDLDGFLSFIPNDHGIVGIIYFEGKKYSHCVVFARMGNELVLYDSQVKNSIVGVEDITSHLIKNNVIGIEYLMGIGKATENNPSAPWKDLSVDTELPTFNNPSQKIETNYPVKYYPSIFSDYTVDGIYPDKLTPEMISNTDIYYDTMEYPDKLTPEMISDTDIYYDTMEYPPT